MRLTSVDEVAKLTALRCAPNRVADVRAKIAEAGIVLRGHFQLQSGAHSEYFLRARGLSSRPDLLDFFARELLSLVEGHNAQAVLCPESGGFAIGDAVAHAAGIPVAVTKTDTNRRPSSELRTGVIRPGSVVLLVNDVATSGSSLRSLHQAAEASGARVEHALTLAVVGTGPLQVTNDLGMRGSWLIEARWPVFPPESCALCKADVPLLLSAELG